MRFDREKYNTELQQQIEKHLLSVRRMPDNELKMLYERMVDNVDNTDGHDAPLFAACYREVHRRYLASGWLWKRILNNKQYKDWKDYMQRIEAKATKHALDVIQKHKSEA